MPEPYPTEEETLGPMLRPSRPTSREQTRPPAAPPLASDPRISLEDLFKVGNVQIAPGVGDQAQFGAQMKQTPQAVTSMSPTEGRAHTAGTIADLLGQYQEPGGGFKFGAPEAAATSERLMGDLRGQEMEERQMGLKEAALQQQGQMPMQQAQANIAEAMGKIPGQMQLASNATIEAVRLWEKTSRLLKHLPQTIDWLNDPAVPPEERAAYLNQVRQETAVTSLTDLFKLFESMTRGAAGLNIPPAKQEQMMKLILGLFMQDNPNALNELRALITGRPETKPVPSAWGTSGITGPGGPLENVGQSIEDWLFAPPQGPLGPRIGQ